MIHVQHYALEGPLFFYGGELSSFARRPVLITPGYWDAPQGDHVDRHMYGCREEYYQAAKATTRIDHDWVIEPGYDTWAVKKRGQQVRIRPDWEEVKYDVMLTYMRVELEQHHGLREFLRITGDRFIAEDSPTDFIWGIRDAEGGFTGTNLLGKAWMQVRSEFGLGWGIVPNPYAGERA